MKIIKKLDREIDKELQRLFLHKDDFFKFCMTRLGVPKPNTAMDQVIVLASLAKASDRNELFKDLGEYIDSLSISKVIELQERFNDFKAKDYL